MTDRTPPDRTPPAPVQTGPVQTGPAQTGPTPPGPGPTPPIARLSRRTVYRNRWMVLHEDAVRFAGGAQGIYGVVDKPDFAAILPLDDAGRLHLVRQFRYPVGEALWEIPMGAWEDAPGTDPETLARAELAEETGLIAARLQPLGTLFAAPALIAQTCHLFLATGLTPGVPAREATEADMTCAAFPLAEVQAMACDGRIRCAVTLAALARLLLSGRG